MRVSSIMVEKAFCETLDSDVVIWRVSCSTVDLLMSIYSKIRRISDTVRSITAHTLQ